MRCDAVATMTSAATASHLSCFTVFWDVLTRQGNMGEKKKKQRGRVEEDCAFSSLRKTTVCFYFMLVTFFFISLLFGFLVCIFNQFIIENYIKF